MTTLKDELRLRGYGYNSQLTNRAQDIFLIILKNCAKALALF